MTTESGSRASAFPISEKDFHGELVEVWPRVRAFAISLTRDVSSAEELTSIVIERALEKRHLYGSRIENSLFSWLALMTRRLYLNQIRDQKRRQSVDADCAYIKNFSPSSEELIIDRLTIDRVLTELTHLPRQDREILELKLQEI